MRQFSLLRVLQLQEYSLWVLLCHFNTSEEPEYSNFVIILTDDELVHILERFIEPQIHAIIRIALSYDFVMSVLGVPIWRISIHDALIFLVLTHALIKALFSSHIMRWNGRGRIVGLELSSFRRARL